jgi:hypothetical protein
MEGTPMPEAPIDEDHQAPAGERQVDTSPWQTSDAQLDSKPAPALVKLPTKQELRFGACSSLPGVPIADLWIWPVSLRFRICGACSRFPHSRGGCHTSRLEWRRRRGQASGKLMGRDVDRGQF